MYEETLKKLEQAKKDLEDISQELGFDLLDILGNRGVSLNDTFPALLEGKGEEISRKDLLRFFKAFFTFQSLTLTCLDLVIINSLNETIIKTSEKKREIENKIWQNYFERLMGNNETDR